MEIGIYQNAASLSALDRWQDSVTQNIASSQLSGYRKRSVDFVAEASGQLQAGGDASQAGVFPRAANSISFTQGEPQSTGRELDVAIQGQGFFEVQGADGKKAYTRDGEFHVEPDNTITTGAGLSVLSESGTPITLLPTGGTVVINPDGTVNQNGTPLGKLSIQKFADTSQLTPGPNGTFTALGGPPPTPVEKPDLLQGYTEGSNVSPMHEMVDLITISRAYEANQKMITTIDQEQQKTFDALG
jgi:flagellar basal body rod protein FlgG